MVRGDSRSSNAFAHTEIEIMRSAQLVRHGAEDHQGRTHTIVPSYQGSQCWDAGLSDRLAPNYLKVPPLAQESTQSDTRYMPCQSFWSSFSLPEFSWSISHKLTTSTRPELAAHPRPP